MGEEIKKEERMVESEKLEHSRYLNLFSTVVLILAMILIAIWNIFSSMGVKSIYIFIVSMIVIVTMIFLSYFYNKKAKNKEKNIRILRRIAKEEIEKEISLREFFSNPETGEPNFIVVVGNTYHDYIEPVKEFVKIISEEFFSYREIIPQYAKTKHFGWLTMKKEIEHFVEVDERTLIWRDDEIKEVHKIGFNLLLIGFIEDNTLIKDLVDQGLSKIDWLYSNGNYEYIPDAFVKGKAAIICSGETAEAIPNAIKKLAERLGKEYI